LDQRHELFHFRRKPADARVAMIATAGLLRPIAAEERPILRPAVIEPKPVLGHDRPAQALEGCVGPNAVLVRKARGSSDVAEAELPGERARSERMTARCELQTVVSQTRLTMGRAPHFGEH